MCGDDLCEGYLTEFAQVSNEFIARGIQVILDFHEDIYTRSLGGCGLPQASLPKHLQNEKIELENNGLAWG